MPETFDFAAESSDLLERAMRAFAEWASENWTMTEAEARTLNEPTDAPAAYARGYNAGVESILAAFECWNEDHQ